MPKTTQSVAITVPGDPHTIWIAPRKTFGAASRAEWMQLRENVPPSLAILLACIDAWDGPRYVNVPVSVAALEAEEPLERNPLLAAVVTAVFDYWFALPPPMPEEGTDPVPNPGTPPGASAGPAISTAD